MRRSVRSRSSLLAGTLALALLPGVLPAALLGGARAQEPEAPEPYGPPLDEAPVETRAFSIPETRLVRALHERALEHLAARRWGEALEALQRILEDHPGDVLGPERPLDARGHKSDQPVHAGAAARARAILAELPAEARALYAERHAREADAALAAARAHGDARALVALAQRWPLTAAAESAWWALGDLAAEGGRGLEASWAWARAIAARLDRANPPPHDAESWRATRARLAERSVLDAGVEARSALAIAAQEDAAPRGAEWSSLLPAGTSHSALPPPGPSDDAWSAPYRLPAHPLERTPRSDALYPARAGELLYVNTGLQLIALSAYGGELAWDCGEAAGWESLSDTERAQRFAGIRPEKGEAMLGSAAGGGVVVAPLQVAYTHLTVENFQKIRITTPIPERRLHAFDAETGAPLWSHAPPADWDGERGSVAQRMTCVSPPVLAGGRVLALLARMEGRIELHLGCFELASGDLLWSTALVSGQRELNMFGRADREFCAPPARVQGDRVIVLTQLGTLVCLDLFGGSILWTTPYEQIPIPRNRGFEAPERETVWRNAAPVVAGNVVLATPYDSQLLLALDLETGAHLWDRRWSWIQSQARRAGGVDLLLGAADRSIYLGGDRLLALEAPSGLASQARLHARWTWPEDDALRYRVGRPLFAGDRVIAPFDGERIELAAEDGRELARIPWPGGVGGGNLLLLPGELYALSGNAALGVFEWSALIERARARLAAAPGSVERALDLARLYAGRARADWGRGQGELARARWAEASLVLRRALGQAGGEGEAELRAELAQCLRGEAGLRAELADPDGALSLLREARGLTSDPGERAAALLEECAILRARATAAHGALLAALAELEQIANAPPDQTLRVAPSELAADASRGLRARFEPLGREEPAGERTIARVPLAAWVLLERAWVTARMGDVATELEALHELLAQHADVDVLVASVGLLATERILALASSAPPEARAPFDVRAAAALAVARDVGGSTPGEGGTALESVMRLYPGSPAAREAGDLRLEQARERADLGAVARVVHAELGEGVARAAPRARELLLTLCATANAAGSRELAAGLLRGLAQSAPEHVPSVADFPREPLAALAARAPRFETSPGTSETGSFAPELGEPRQTWPGAYEVLGIAPAADAVDERAANAPRTLIVLLRSARAGFGESTVSLLQAIGSDDPSQPRWSMPVPEPEPAPSSAGTMPSGAGAVPLARAAFAAGRTILALRSELLAFDTRDGRVVWSWRPPFDAEVLGLCAAGGVCVVGAFERGGQRALAVGLDAHGGALLWMDPLVERGVQRQALADERHVVHVPAPGQTAGLVRDLYTGRVTARFELDSAAVGSLDQEAWCQDGLLVVPRFAERGLAERNPIVAFDLDLGEPRWRLPFESGPTRRMLTGVVQQGARTWLRIGSLPRDEDPLPAPRMAELAVGVGAASPLDGVRLSAEDRILGLARDTRVRLPAGPLFILSPNSNSREARLRAIDPERGELWVQSLGLMFDDLAGMSAAWSDRAVVVSLPVYDHGQRGRGKTILSSFDLATGLPRGDWEVERKSRGDLPQLYACGGMLVVSRSDVLEILR